MTEDELIENPLQALSIISETINSTYEIDVLLRNILDIALKTVHAQRGVILLYEGDTLSVKIAHNIAAQSEDHLDQFSRSVVYAALDTGETIISYNIVDDIRFNNSESVSEQKIVAAACLPLRIRSQPVGAVYLDSTETRGRFRPEMEPFLNAFAHQAALAIENAQMYDKLIKENRNLQKRLVTQNSIRGIIGSSPAIHKVHEMIRSVADVDATVLILGESGTGKELVARALHYSSSFRDKPFIACFCGSLPETLLESELFGHKAGAFTGANHDKKGLFEEAEGGTFFLDEIADISPRVQVQLLRVLQEREIKRIGENTVRKINVRIVAATNKDLREEVKAGRFREDLFYRLNVITINMPPLRARGDDVILLAQHFLDRTLQKLNKTLNGFSEDGIDALRRYPWPGNVRELENCIERAAVLCKGEQITAHDLQLDIPDVDSVHAQPNGKKNGRKLKEFERTLVQKTLQESNGNVSQAARVLGVSRRWLHYRIKEWGL
ncbi:MAG TPA: sigma-54-dependent Fis family transcriptional regulator [Bacteroidetes bacterium]|nr:sigma-54-dependent Fis family transcriptional regulator [Bacteroidota bacterium]